MLLEEQEMMRRQVVINTALNNKNPFHVLFLLGRWVYSRGWICLIEGKKEEAAKEKDWVWLSCWESFVEGNTRRKQRIRKGASKPTGQRNVRRTVASKREKRKKCKQDKEGSRIWASLLEIPFQD